MAEPIVRYIKDNDEIVYPITVAEAVKMRSGMNLDQYMKKIRDDLDALIIDLNSKLDLITMVSVGGDA